MWDAAPFRVSRAGAYMKFRQRVDEATNYNAGCRQPRPSLIQVTTNGEAELRAQRRGVAGVEAASSSDGIPEDTMAPELRVEKVRAAEGLRSAISDITSKEIDAMLVRQYRPLSASSLLMPAL